MSKNNSYPRNIIFAVFLTLVFASFAFSQNAGLQSDLSRSFTKFDLVKLGAEADLRQTENGKKLSIRTAERDFELVLVPRDLRAPRYSAEETSDRGVRQMEKSAVTTFKGKVFGESVSEVRLTIEGGRIEGYFDADDERFFIETAQKYSRFAAQNDLVVYRQRDLISENGFICHSEMSVKIERGKTMIAENAVNSVQALRVIEIATEADFEYVTALGGTAAANTEILSILNMAEGVYETELRLTISLVYQHFWTTQDPFTGGNTPTLLSSFQSYWNANNAQIPRDAAHLFTGKSFALGSGYAYISVICFRPSDAYGLSGYVNFIPGNFLVTAHEIGHNLGANHVDASVGCDNTLMNFQLSFNTPLTFCPFSRTEINNFVELRGACLAQAFKSPFDFDGDGRSDIAIFRPALGQWWINRSSTGATFAAQFGAASDKIVPADYTGDGKTDLAIFRPASGEWFVLRSEDSSFYSFPFGSQTDIPAPADFDGDGKADAAVFRSSNSTWFISKSSGGTTIQQFGQTGDFPVPADYDGDNKADIAIFRSVTGQWWRQRSSDLQTVAVQFGAATDKAVQGDYTGDGKADVAVFRPTNSTWFVLRSEDGSFYSAPFGASGDVPAPADFDGDGKFDFAVFRPSNQTWFAQRTAAGTLIQQFGSAGDKPVPSAFVP